MSRSNHAHPAYELEAVGRYGVVEHFEKPWALTAVMFLGMSLCLPVAYYYKLREQDEHQQHMHAPALQQPILRRVRTVWSTAAYTTTIMQVFDAAELRDAAMLSVPAVLDLIATVLMYVGLLSVTASVYQMLRGAMLVFAALFGTVFLKRQLNSLHYGGIIGTLIGIAIVGAASLLSGEGSATRDVPQAEMVAGLLACIAGQVGHRQSWHLQTRITSIHTVHASSAGHRRGPPAESAQDQPAQSGWLRRTHRRPGHRRHRLAGVGPDRGTGPWPVRGLYRHPHRTWR